MMKRIKSIVSLGFLFTVFINANAQEIYPRQYFRNPLNIPIQLAANFGELRTDHFHMGLDIRTQSRENLPVYAAAEGYVSRIRIEKSGYGRAIYINHPNGYTTLYAHLNSFYPALEQYLKNKQYQDEAWEHDIELPADLFVVAKGQFIAHSGNTGGSQGPHLHFEIRDTETGNNLNPLLFGLGIPDNIPPIVYSLFWYDRRYSAYMIQPQAIPVIKKNNVYTTSATVQVGSPIVALGLRMEDMNNVSSFKFGVYNSKLYVDDVLIFEYKLNDFSYDSSRYVNACMDYARWIKNRQGIQHLSILPGNKINIFSGTETDGKIILNDTATHKIRIKLSDENQNVSVVDFSLKYDPRLEKNYDLPGNAIVCDVNEVNNIETANAKISFSKNAFYDALPLVVSENSARIPGQASPSVSIGNNTIPVHDDYSVMIKKDASIADSLKDKIVLQLKRGNSSTIKKGLWQGDWMFVSFDELGDVRLMIDTIAPVIIAAGWKNGSTFTNQKTLTIKCTDDLSRIETFNATLDGRWLMFAKKNDFFTYSFDEHCTTGKHTLSVIATDIAGNVKSQTFNFTKH